MTTSKRIFACTWLVVTALSVAPAQTAGASTSQATGSARPATPGAIAAHPDWPRASPDDVDSPQAIVAALSETISGQAGKPRDWNRFRSLFVPGAGRLVVTRVPKSGPADVTVLSIDDYIAHSSGGASQSFYEIPIAYQVEGFGRMTHVYESYGLHHAKDEAPYVRGVNSWELLFDGTRYYVLQVFWDTERPDNPLPANLLK